MRFLFVCGGTAGHINPALALAGELRNILPDCEILFVGSGRELENRLIPMEGYKIVNITMTGFARGIKPGQIKKNIGTVKNLVIAAKQSKKILEEFKPDVAIGTGGYVCYPVLNQAAKMKIPTLIHESNAVPGLTTKMLSGKVDKVLTAFEGMEKMYKKPERVIMTGTPVRGGFDSMSYQQARQKLGIGDKPLVVSFWGSLGAVKLNAIMPEFIRLNSASGLFKHIHATGGGENGVKNLMESLNAAGIKLPEDTEIRPYIDDMPTVMNAADLVLCRAGASTLSELTDKGKPAVIIPSPNVTNNHQQRNAEQLEKSGGAVMILEQDCTAQKLYDTVAGLLCDRQKLESMSAALKKMSVPNAANNIADMIISMC